jgi:hypothetical protein
MNEQSKLLREYDTVGIANGFFDENSSFGQFLQLSFTVLKL